MKRWWVGGEEGAQWWTSCSCNGHPGVQPPSSDAAEIEGETNLLMRPYRGDGTRDGDWTGRLVRMDVFDWFSVCWGRDLADDVNVGYAVGHSICVRGLQAPSTPPFLAS